MSTFPIVKNPTIIELRNDTAANWTSFNPILHVGELGYEYDTVKFKIGDGSTVWASLAYFETGDGLWNANGSDIYFNTGNVGVGTDSPGLDNGSSTRVLEIEGTQNPALAIYNSAATQQWAAYVADVGGLFNIFDATGNTVPFQIETTAPSNSLYIDSAGQIGIKSAGPATMLMGQLPSAAAFEKFTIQPNTEGTSAALGKAGFGMNAITADVIRAGMIVEQIWDGVFTDYQISFQTHDGGVGDKTGLLLDKNGRVGVGTLSPDRLFHAEVADAITNVVTYAQRLSHITSGTAAASFGTGIEFELEGADGTFLVSGAIENVWTDASTGAEDADLIFKVSKGGAVATEVIRVKADNVILVTGDINPEADGTRDLGVQTTAQWANVWSDLINGADYSYLNGWRTLEADKYLGYPAGFAIGTEGFKDGQVTAAMPGNLKPLFVVAEDFIEFKGRRLTTKIMDKLIALMGE